MTFLIKQENISKNTDPTTHFRVPTFNSAKFSSQTFNNFQVLYPTLWGVGSYYAPSVLKDIVTAQKESEETTMIFWFYICTQLMYTSSIGGDPGP